MKKILKKIICKLNGSYHYSGDELRKRGARVGGNFQNYGHIDIGHAYLLTIGNNVTLSDCRILLHDASTKNALGFTKIACVNIGDNVFVGADAIVLPGVSIGNNCIIGAGSVVTKAIPDNSVAAGNPATVISSFDDYIQKNETLMKKLPVFHTHYQEKTDEEKRNEFELVKASSGGFDI